MADDDLVILQSYDGKDFQVSVKTASMSETIKSLIVDSGTKDPIPLPNVDGETLAKVVEYCTYHAENPDPIVVGDDATKTKDPKITNDISEWDSKFCNIQYEPHCKLILAANYLDVKGLLDLTTKEIANKYIKGKTVEQMRAAFNIKDTGWTPEEEAAVRAQNAWVED